MKKQKLYFGGDDSHVESLEDHLRYAKDEGLSEIKLFEAIEYNESDYTWCIEAGMPVEKHQCKKSCCSSYASKSGRGVCNYRGQLYKRGELKTFSVE